MLRQRCKTTSFQWKKIKTRGHNPNVALSIFTRCPFEELRVRIITWSKTDKLKIGKIVKNWRCLNSRHLPSSSSSKQKALMKRPEAGSSRLLVQPILHSMWCMCSFMSNSSVPQRTPPGTSPPMAVSFWWPQRLWRLSWSSFCPWLCFFAAGPSEPGPSKDPCKKPQCLCVYLLRPTLSSFIETLVFNHFSMPATESMGVGKIGVVKRKAYGPKPGDPIDEFRKLKTKCTNTSSSWIFSYFHDILLMCLYWSISSARFEGKVIFSGLHWVMCSNAQKIKTKSGE